MAAVMAAGAVAAQVDSRTARNQTFPERGRSVEVADLSFLGAAERAAVEEYAKQFDYYGAMAVSPGDPADTGSAVAVANYHSVRAAQKAALDGCNARRRTGRACVIVATVLPRRYQARGFTLSVEGTAALKGAYRRLDSPKAFAISEATGAFGFARGDGARALSACNERAAPNGARDCRVVVVDP
ncbi:MAG: hypothetical protein AAFR44_06750 [Pseudomonadota bacterium]